MLAAALSQATRALQQFTTQMQQIQAGAATITVTVTPGGDATSDRLEADAIKRGQKPQTVAAMRAALGG